MSAATLQSGENELVTRFGFQGSIRPLMGYSQGLVRAGANLAAFTAGGLVAARAVSSIKSAMFDTLHPLREMGERTGLAVETLQRMAAFATLGGKRADAMLQTVDALNSTIANAAVYGNDTFSRFGISVRTASGDIKKAHTVLFELAHAYKVYGLTLQQQIEINKALGVNPEMTTLFARPSKDLRSLFARARMIPNVSSDEVYALREYQGAMGGLMTMLRRLASMLGSRLAKAFTGNINAALKALSRHVGDITSAFDTMVTWIGWVVSALGRLVTLLPHAGWALLVFAAPFAPILLKLAAIVAALLLLEDVIVGFMGGESASRDFLKDFLGIDIAETPKQIEDFLGQVREAFANVAKDIAAEALAFFPKAISAFFGGGFSDEALDAADAIRAENERKRRMAESADLALADPGLIPVGDGLGGFSPGQLAALMAPSGGALFGQGGRPADVPSVRPNVYYVNVRTTGDIDGASIKRVLELESDFPSFDQQAGDLNEQLDAVSPRAFDGQ